VDPRLVVHLPPQFQAEHSKKTHKKEKEKEKGHHHPKVVPEKNSEKEQRRKEKEKERLFSHSIIHHSSDMFKLTRFDESRAKAQSSSS